MSTNDSTAVTLDESTMALVQEWLAGGRQISTGTTNRANGTAKQAVAAFAMAPDLYRSITAHGSKAVGEATGIEKAKVDRIGYVARLTAGLSDREITAASVEDVVALWKIANGSKGVKADVMDRIGRQKFATVGDIVDATKALMTDEPTVARAMSALAKALEMLVDVSVQPFTDDQIDALGTAQDTIAAVLATIDEVADAA
jgi:hypothetical protein